MLFLSRKSKSLVSMSFSKILLQIGNTDIGLIVCIPSPFLLGGGGLNLQPNFQKWGLERMSSLRGGLLGKRGMIFSGRNPTFRGRVYEKPIYRGDCLKRGWAWTVC